MNRGWKRILVDVTDVPEAKADIFTLGLNVELTVVTETDDNGNSEVKA